MVDEAGRGDQAFRIDGAVACQTPRLSCRRRIEIALASGAVAGSMMRAFLMASFHFSPRHDAHHGHPDAMPKGDCGRITECGPSATAESISTPRFIGPGA